MRACASTISSALSISGDFWRDEFDWRGVEARLNQLPQYTTLIDGQRIHFVHVKSAVPGARTMRQWKDGA